MAIWLESGICWTPMGAYLDPLADKLMVTVALVMLIPLGWAPAWLISILLCREIAITGLRGIASQQNLVLAASPLGKLARVSIHSHRNAAVALSVDWPLFGHTDIHSCGIVLLYVSVFFAVISGIEYGYLYYKASQRTAWRHHESVAFYAATVV